MRADLVVVILAGGEGRRMDGAKPAAELDGLTLLARVITKARLWSNAPAVAVRDGVDVAGFQTLTDDPAIQGPLAGLASALAYARREGARHVLTLPCDAPFLPDDLAARLASAIGGAGAAIPASGGRLHPTCGLWRVDKGEALAAYAATGRRSLTGFAETVGSVEVNWAGEPDPFFNINTAEDLARAEAWLRPIAE